MKTQTNAIAAMIIGAMVSTTALADDVSTVITTENSVIRTAPEIKTNPVNIQDYVNIARQDAGDVVDTSVSTAQKSRWNADNLL